MSDEFFTNLPKGLMFMKGLMKDKAPTFHEWDNPVNREVDGKLIKGRPTLGYGDFSFEYAGKYMEPRPWTDHAEMPYIRKAATTLTCEFFKQKKPEGFPHFWGGHRHATIDPEVTLDFQFCLVGLYEDGTVDIPHHSDTVPSEDDLVLSISYGAPRLFVWRKYDRKIKDVPWTSKINMSKLLLDSLPHKDYYFILEDGDALLFTGKSQLYSTHAVPVSSGALGRRVNLTFRTGMEGLKHE
tara:strand:+ start:6404 stop:7123 length:720 start_codon:yes stop_codon:yes gene_type:complete